MIGKKQQIPRLKIVASRREDIYRDIARVPEQYRLTPRGKRIREGLVCLVEIAGRRCYLILRGDEESPSPSPTIQLDGKSRDVLTVRPGQELEVRMKPVWLFRQVLWAWNASDPAYRIASRLGVISLFLGIVGLVLGLK